MVELLTIDGDDYRLETVSDERPRQCLRLPAPQWEQGAPVSLLHAHFTVATQILKEEITKGNCRNGVKRWRRKRLPKALLVGDVGGCRWQRHSRQGQAGGVGLGGHEVDPDAVVGDRSAALVESREEEGRRSAAAT